jgi:hypothetical protein
VSDLYVTQDGYKPLHLPATGEELISGRQYYLSPVARVTIEEVYGLRGIPSVVECILAKRPRTRLCTTRTNLDTGESFASRDIILEGQHETFVAFIKFKKHLKFTLDLAKIHELAPFYVDSDRVRDYETTDKVPAAPKQEKKPDLSILDL